jgi:hypothetical protein
LRVKYRASLRVRDNHTQIAGGAGLGVEAREWEQQKKRREDTKPQFAEVPSAQLIPIPHPRFAVSTVARSCAGCGPVLSRQLITYFTGFQGVTLLRRKLGGRRTSEQAGPEAGSQARLPTPHQ